MPTEPLKHATLVFERTCAAPVARVFAALANPVERASWGTPSGNARYTMSTTVLAPEKTDTKVTVTLQLISLAGDDMLDGAETGYSASLDNLAEAMS
jgi:uncharacterized protein YndB with AHSA1/START domain